MGIQCLSIDGTPKSRSLLREKRTMGSARGRRLTGVPISIAQEKLELKAFRSARYPENNL